MARCRRAPAAALVLLVGAALGLLAAGCAPDENNSSGPANTGPLGAQGSVVDADAGTPQPGGSVIFGLEADSDGFDPLANRWAISGTMVALAVYDPLTAYNDKGDAKPYLAESITPNSTYDVWTIKLRAGIQFSDGSPLRSDAVKTVLDGHMASALTAASVLTMQSVSVKDELTVEVRMRSPWVSFPGILGGQTGVVPKPSTLNDKSATDHPIGSGPFKLDEWRKDASWKGSRNPHYWRKDDKGAPLPYLDSVEFRPITDAQQRSSALEAGTIQMLHTDNSDVIAAFRKEAADGGVKMVEDAGEGEEDFILLNQSKPPFDDVNLRKALAYATDSATYIQTTLVGLNEPAQGPFRKGSKWYSEVKGYPAFDLTKARQLVDAYTKGHGDQPPSFTFGTGSTTNATTAQQAQLLQSLWQQAGFKVDIKKADQTSFIQDAIVGDYQADLWRQYGAPDADADYHWWASTLNGGDNILNFGRMKSECVDGALKKGRESPQDSARMQAYADLQQCLADEVPFVWLDHDIWAIVATPKVHRLSNGPLPDGEPSLPLAAGDFSGVLRMTAVWIEH